jgi:hypothetical protein
MTASSSPPLLAVVALEGLACRCSPLVLLVGNCTGPPVSSIVGLAAGDLNGVSCLTGNEFKRGAGRRWLVEERLRGDSGDGCVCPLLGVSDVELSLTEGLSGSPSSTARRLADGLPSGEAGSRSV